MNRAFQTLSVCVLLLFVMSNLTLGQEWETYESKEYNIQFDVPAKWKTTHGIKKDIPYLESESPDGSVVLFVYVYEDSEISTEELFDKAVDDLDLDLEGEAEEEEINGLHAWVGEATGKIEGEKVGMFIMAATYDEFNYVAYIFTEEAKFEKNAKVMNKILDSFEPIEK